MKVSVIIPVYNRANMVSRAIKSVLEQTYLDFELIVVDDGSAEDFSSVRQLVESSGHRYLKQNHLGVSAARNTGIRAARSDWLTFLDSDDTWRPNKLSEQVKLHQSQPALKFSQCKEEWVRNGKPVQQNTHQQMPEGEAFLSSVRLCVISSSSVMIHRELFEKYGDFDEQMRVCEDYDLWLRLTAFVPIGLVHLPLVIKHGGHLDQLSRSEPAIDRFRVYALLKILMKESLSELQLEAVKEQLSEKTCVLIKGAKKRQAATITPLIALQEYIKEGEFASALKTAESLIFQTLLS